MTDDAERTSRAVSTGYATPQKLELSQRSRERLLRNIIAAGEAGLKVTRRARGPRTPAKLPYDATKLLGLKYAVTIGKTREVTDRTGTYDVTEFTFLDPGGTEHHQLMRATELGKEAIAAIDAWEDAQAQRRKLLDAGRLRRAFPGGSAVIKFDADGELELELYPAYLGQDFRRAVEHGLVDPSPTVSKRGAKLTYRLTPAGKALRERIEGAAEPDAPGAGEGDDEATGTTH